MQSTVLHSTFGLASDHFVRVGMIVSDYIHLGERDLRRKLISVFRHEVSENHFKAMYYHIGANHTARNGMGNFNDNILCLREN